MRIVTMLVLVAALTAESARSVYAQTCGDANDDDAVSVTDGVQALRAAADLSTTCGEGCDVDASGAISVTDGVNILRRVAGLSFPDACEFTGEETNEVVTPSTGIFDAIGKLPGIGGAEAAGTPECENDGTVNVDGNDGTTIAAFANCEIGGIILDGAVARANLAQAAVVGFDALTITRIKTGKSLTYSGQLALGDSAAGKRLSGTLKVDSDERGSFTLRFTRVLIVANGSPRDGDMLIDLADVDGGTIESILIVFDTGNELAVRVQLRNGQVKQFILDRRTRLVRLPL
jgi:hypothetical protein